MGARSAVAAAPTSRLLCPRTLRWPLSSPRPPPWLALSGPPTADSVDRSTRIPRPRRSLPINPRARWLLGWGVGDDGRSLPCGLDRAGVAWLVAAGAAGGLGDERVA